MPSRPRGSDGKSLLLLTALLALAVMLSLPDDAFWITDCGNKFLLTSNLVKKDYRDFSLDYPGRELDPELVLNPISRPFSVTRDGRIYSIYPPLFSFVSAPVFAFAGFRGLLILPLLGSLAVMLVVRKIALLYGLSPLQASLAGLASFWCTPCLFYTFCFWEHTLANACVLGSVLLLLKAPAARKNLPLFLSGAVIGLGIGLRDELILTATAILAALLMERSRRRVSLLLLPAGALAALVPVLFFQEWAVGSALGFHTEGYLRASQAWVFSGPAGILKERLLVAWNLLGAVPAGTPVAVAYTGLFLGLCILSLRGGKHPTRTGIIVCLGGALLAATSGMLFLTAQDTVRAWTDGSGLVTHGALLLPAASVFLFRGQSASAELVRLLRNIVLVSLALLCLTAHEVSTQGIHWGPRFLLPVFPLLVLLAFFSVSGRKPVQVHSGDSGERTGPAGGQGRIRRFHIFAFAGLLVSCLVLQMYSLGVLRQKLETTRGIEERLLAYPEEVVVTNIWWFPQEMAPIFYEKTFFHVKRPEQLRGLRGSLRERGVESFLFVADDLELENPLYRSDSALAFFNVAISRMRP
jgi:hypothetical protein